MDYSVSNLVSLLVVLSIVFGILVIAALVLRMRIKGLKAASPLLGNLMRRKSSPLDMKPGDSLTILGRIFQVVDLSSFSTTAGKAIWCCLDGENHSARLIFWKDSSPATYFPGQGDTPQPEPFPECIQRENQPFQRQEEPFDLGDNWKLARYRGPNERWLAIENHNNQTVLWRGKSIPSEGVTILEKRQISTQHLYSRVHSKSHLSLHVW